MTKLALPLRLTSWLLPSDYALLFVSVGISSKVSRRLQLLSNFYSHRIMTDPICIDSVKQVDPNDAKTLNYPSPLSPPLPLMSKNIELNRAMSASSKSSLFALSVNDIIFEDNWLIVVNKPQGIYCESVLTSIPRLFDNSSDSSSKLGTAITPPELHLANRLDRDTSGVMVITKSHKIAGKLVKAFTAHEVTKTYIALCIGSAPKWDKISIDSGHGRSKFGAWRVYAASDVGRTLPGGSMVRDMATSFEVLSVNGQGRFREPSEPRRDENVVVVEDRAVINGEKRDEIVIRAYPRSGRTHQIRLHCQHLGISILGDVKYGGLYEWKGRTYDGHALHAESLSFDHPVSGLPVEFRAPLPLWATQGMSQPHRRCDLNCSDSN